MVARKALFEALSADDARAVTLVSAPPGSGKSTLLRLWIEETGLRKRTAWVSVQRGERDTQHFWLAVLQELRNATCAEGVVDVPAATPDFDGKAAVERLVTGLQLLKEPAVLVIDDLHELNSADAFSQLELLLMGRPPLLHIVLSTRRDPPLQLHLLRLSGELLELRAADLRFTPEETRELLAASGIELPDASIDALQMRTEGWAAGLRLATISLTNRPDPARFIAEFSGSERTVAEYLLSEVLQRQPDDMRQLLLRTSILEQVNGELADLLVGRTGSERLLQSLEQGNTFVTAVDASRTWFRYHHLFADLLRLELRRTEPDCVARLHQTAARWYVQHGYVVEAIRHTQEARDWIGAAHLLADHYFTLLLNGQNATVIAILEAFPADVAEPEIAVVEALARPAHGSLEEAEAYLSVAERKLLQLPADRRRRHEMALAVARLAIARRRGDFGSVVSEVQNLTQAANSNTLDDVALGNDLRAIALMNLGIAEKWSFRFDEGERHLEQGVELARRIGRPYVEIHCLSYLGLERTDSVHDVARERCAEAIAKAQAQGWETDPIMGIALTRMSAWAVREGRFDDAWQWMKRAEQSFRPDLEPAIGLLYYLARGALYLADHRLEDALRALRAAQRLQTLLVTNNLFSISTTRLLVQTQLRLGDVQGARVTLDAVAPDERDCGDMRVAFASLHLAEGDLHAAIETLAPVLNGSARAIYTFTAQHAFLLDAQARDGLGEKKAAHDDIERALDVAQKEGSFSPFAITTSRARLERHMQEGTEHAALLSQIVDTLAGASMPAPSGDSPALEQLSEGQTRVLRYLASNLTASEIGAELHLSVHTVKTHMREIYAKLGAHSRSEAVDRARKLHLLAPRARQDSLSKKR